MKRPFLGFLRTTLVGGLTFLLPIVLVAWLFQKAMEIARKMAEPAMALLPERFVGGIIIGALETATALLILAFLAGLLARTGPGQRFMAWVENSLIGSLPQFSFVRGIAESVDDSGQDGVDVVLVPADAGWALGFVFEAVDGEVVPVFLPGSPQWTSGSVVFAERKSIKPAGIDFAQGISIMRKLGVGSGDVVAAIGRSNPD